MRRTTTTAAAAAGIVGLVLTGATLLPASAETPGDDDFSTPSVRTDRLDRLREALEPLVEDGTLTEEEADTVAETLDGSEALARGGHGMRGVAALSLDVAAEVLGLSAEELRGALREGSALAEVAADQGIDTATLVDVLVRAASERIDAAVADGSLSLEDADELRTDLEERIAERVEAAPGLHGPGMPGARSGHGPGHGDSIMPGRAGHGDGSGRERSSAGDA